MEILPASKRFTIEYHEIGGMNSVFTKSTSKSMWAAGEISKSNVQKGEI